MLFIAGVIFMIVGVIMTIRYIRNSLRPKLEGKIIEVFMDHVKTDKYGSYPKHKHAKITYIHEGKLGEAVIPAWKKAEVGEVVQVSYLPKDMKTITLYAPGREILAMAIIYGIGLGIISICVFVLDYFDAW